MHKCRNCSTEFQGKFCPECGAKWVEHKTCPKCGVLFGATMKFCPECGTKWVEHKTCPECGANSDVSASFCGECGYSFLKENEIYDDNQNEYVEEAQESFTRKTVKTKIKAEDAPSTAYLLVKNIPVLLLLLFSVLMLIFFSVNVATMPSTTMMGVSVPSQPYGSIYGEVLDNLPEINGVVVALIIFTSLIAVYTLFCVLISVLKRTKNYRVLFLGKYDVLLSEMLTILSPVLYAVFIVLSSVLMGKLSSLDGGSGLIEVAAYPKLVLAFSIIFFVFALALSILRVVKYNAFLTQGGSMSAARKAELAEFYETHEPPTGPATEVTKPGSVGDDAPKESQIAYNRQMSSYKKYLKEVEAYKFDKHRYDNGKEGKAPTGVVWLSLNKVKITVLAVLVAIAVILLSTLIPYFTNIFRVGKVEDIKLGMSQEEVVDILGDPYDKKDLTTSSSNDILLGGGSGIIDSVSSGKSKSKLAVTRWRYLDEEYAKMRKDIEAQLETIGLKGGIDAIISGGLGGLTGTAASMATVLTPLLSKTYNYIQVDFDEDGEVVKVVLEKSRCDGVTDKKRNVDEMQFNNNNAFDYYNNEGVSNTTLYYYEDFTGDGNSATIVTKERQAWYTAYFDGGSYIRSYIEDFSFKEFANSSKEKVKGTWKDDYAEYSVTQNAKRIGSINVEHEWVNESDEFVDIDFLPNTVTAIADMAFKSLQIKSVVIPDSVTAIGVGAFHGCEKLNKVVMGKNVQSIGENAFSGCSGLRYIGIPDSVTAIGANAFKDCKLFAIHCAANNIPDGWDTDWNSDKYPVYTNCKTVNGINYALRYNSDYHLEAVVIIQDKEIEKAEIPDTVDYQGFVSFYKVAEIAPYAFYNCDKLTDMTIPDGVSVIGSNAFNGCKNIESIVLPNTVKQVGNNAFTNCSSLQFNEYGSGIYLGNNSNPCLVFIELKDKNVTQYKIQDKTSVIADGAFSGCEKLERIEIPESINDLPDGLFDDCKNLSDIVVNEDNSEYSSQSGILYNNERTKIIYVPKSLSGKIVIPNGVISIDDNAFENCVGLTAVELPNSLTSIGSGAFSGCSGLESIEIPESVISIGEQAFQDCNRLYYIVIPNSVTNIESYAFGRNSNTTLFCEVESKPTGWNDSWSINNHIVWGCSKDYNYVIIDNVCYALKDNEATVISQNPNINKIVIPEYITHNNRMYLIMNIEEGALNGCSSLTSITLPFIGSKATADYASSKTLFGYIFGASAYIGGIRTIQWYGSSSSAYYIPASLRSVTVTGGSVFCGAFQNCSSLTSITIPESVTSIGQWAFSGCMNLTSIEIPNNVTSIGYGAFDGCSLTSVKIPDSVTSIGGCAFYNCDLTSIEIPRSVTSIGGQAFGQCSKLKDVYYKGDIDSWCSITFDGQYANPLNYEHDLYIDNKMITALVIPDTVTEIKDYAFEGSSIISVTIGNSVTSIGVGAFANCRSLTSIAVSSGNSYYSSQDGILYNKDKTKMIQVPRAISGEVTIPYNITSIGDRAFYYCSSLASIILPNSVTSIGEEAFYECRSLTRVTMGNSVVNIGKCAFIYCFGILDVFFNGSVMEWCNINMSTEWVGFSPLYYGANLYVNGVILTETIIPETVSEIVSGAFYGCESLTSITIPNSLTSIMKYAFGECSSLTCIKFNGTKAQWKAISKASSWNYNTSNYTVICTDGTLSKSES